MLREFGFKNYYGFKEGLTVSFALGANCPEIVSQGQPFSSIMAVKGANASGKTTVLRGISFLAQFVVHSFAYDPDTHLPFSSHFDSTEPCELYAEFTVGEVTYSYEVELLELAVVREVLYRTKAKKTKVIERVGNELTFTISELDALRVMHLRSNVSLISTSRQYGIPGLEDVLEFFGGVVTNVTYSGHIYDGSNSMAVAAELFKDSKKREFVSNFISSIDTGVSDIIIHEYSERDPADPSKSRKVYMPFFRHGSDIEHEITWHTESNGTRALFNRLPRLKQVLDTGGLLVADEFDLHLHPMILPKMLDLFTDKSSNPLGAQLLFTTHDGDVLDYLGKYRCYLVNKRDNESFGYRMDEIPGDILRNDRSVIPAYRAGKVGGLPRI